MNIRLLTYSLIALGVFWALTGAWAVFFVDSFMAATERPWGDPFAVRVNGGLFLLIGLSLTFRIHIFLVFQPVAFFALSVIGIILLAEAYYLPLMQYPTLLVADFILESAFAFLIIGSLYAGAIRETLAFMRSH